VDRARTLFSIHRSFYRFIPVPWPALGLARKNQLRRPPDRSDELIAG
jgi:hypothetical protein